MLNKKNCVKANDMKKTKFKIKKSNKWHTNTNEIVHHNVGTTKEAYTELDHHIRLRTITKVRLTPNLRLKCLSMYFVNLT